MGSMAGFLLVSKCGPVRISAREPPDIVHNSLVFANLPISSYQAYVVCLEFNSVNSIACKECMSRFVFAEVFSRCPQNGPHDPRP